MDGRARASPDWPKPVEAFGSIVMACMAPLRSGKTSELIGFGSLPVKGDFGQGRQAALVLEVLVNL